MTPSLWQKPRGSKEPLAESERGEWKRWLENSTKNEDHGIQSHHFMANRQRKMEIGTDYFLGLQNHCRWLLKPWNLKLLAPLKKSYDKHNSVQPFSQVQLFAIPWTASHQASLSITISWSFLKVTSIESVIPSNHLIFCHPLLLLPSIFHRIRGLSSESALHIR